MPYEIILVSAPDFISQSVRTVWAQADITLVGPVYPNELGDDELRRSGGVLMDVSMEAATLFDLSERLIQFGVPFLFVVNQPPTQGSTKPFVLNALPEDIRAILTALAHEQLEASGGSLQ